MENNMLIPPNYTHIQITVPDDRKCLSIYYRWENIYLTNQDTYSYISHLSLARKYNLIYTLIKTDKLKEIKYPYTTVPLISAENIEFYKLNKKLYLITKEENNIQEIITFDGTEEWHKDSRCHRDNNLPAIIRPDGSQFWYKNGLRHRDNDLPALIYSNGRKEWYQNDKLHRDNDLPAVIEAYGTQSWYKNGKLHRDNDLPAVIETDGTELWYKDGELHRDNNLPSVILIDGIQEWWKDGIQYTNHPN